MKQTTEYGTIITFYSYKGGVGRSMALANIGSVMALEGKKVLLIDWDLEAPGLEKYFAEKERVRSSSYNTERPGIVDLLGGLAEGKEIAWQDCVSTFEFLGTSIDLISSGKRDEGYRKRVQSLDWNLLYSEHDVGEFMEQLREEVSLDYDYILVDSRTGITDIGDVCTVLLPDVLVTLFVSNAQNVEGTIQLVERARQARGKLPVDRSKLLVLPLPSRDESDSEYDLATRWRERYATEFRKILGEWLPSEVSAEDYFDRIYLPYFPVWSFGERLPVIESARELKDPKTLGVAFQNVSRLLVNRLDWDALSDGRNLTELTAARTELQAAKEQFSKDKESLAVRSRRRVLLGGLGAAALSGAAASGLLYFGYLSSQPELIFAFRTRAETGRDFSTAAFSPDGSMLVAGLHDYSLQMWNAESGEAIGTELIGHFGEITDIEFSQSGLRFFSGSKDATVRIWDVEQFEEIREKFVVVVGGSALSIAFSPDGTRIVSGSTDGTLRLWDTSTGAAIGAPLEGHTGWVNSVAFSPDGTRILTGSLDNTARLWDAETGAEIRRLEGHGIAVLSVAFSPDGTRILTGTWDNTARLWDAETGAEIRRIEGHGRPVRSVAFSPDGTRILTGSDDNTARLWNAETGAEIRRIEGHGGSVLSVAFSPDGTRILTGLGDNTARLWDAETGAEIRRLAGHGGAVHSVAFSPDGTRIVSGSDDSTLRLWSSESGKILSLPAYSGQEAILTLDFLSGGDSGISFGTAREVLFLPDRVGIERVSGIQNRPNEILKSGARLISFAPNTTEFALVSAEQTVQIWNLSDEPRMAANIPVEAAAVRAIAYSPDGSYLVTASDDGTARLFSRTTLGAREVEVGKQARVAEFSGNGSRLALGNSDGSVTILDVVDFRVLATLEPEVSNVSDAIVALAFSRNGRILTLASADGVIFSAELVLP